MPTEVKTYEVRVYGGPDGYQGNRAQITLYDAEEKAAGYLRFADADEAIEADEQKGNAVQMHLPLAALGDVLALLQAEADITIHLASGRGFLTVGKQPAGGGQDEKKAGVKRTSPRARRGFESR